MLGCLAAHLPALAQPDFTNYRSGVAHKGRGEYREAITDFTKFLDFNPSYTKAYYHRAYTYLYIRDFRNAQRDFQNILDLEPNNTDGLAGIGECYLEARDYTRAIEYLGKAVQRNPKLADTWNKKGMAHCFAEDFGAGEQCFQAATRADTSFAIAYSNAGAAAYFNQDIEAPSDGDLRAAHRWFSRAVRHDSMLFIAWRNRAAVNYFLKNYPEALTDLAHAAKLNTDDAMTEFYVGVTKEAIGEHRAATIALETASKMDSTLAIAYEEIGNIERNQKSYLSAINFYDRAKDRARNNRAYQGLMDYHIACCYAYEKKEKEMYAALRDALRKGAFSDRAVYKEFVENTLFNEYRVKSAFIELNNEIRAVKKENKFLSPRLRWFRMKT